MIDHERYNPLDFLGSAEVAKHLSPEGVVRVRSVLAATGQPIDRIVRELGLLQDQRLSELFASCLGIESVSEILETDNTVLDLIGIGVATNNVVVPLPSSDALLFAVADPFETAVIRALAYHLNRDYIIKIAPRSTIEEFYSRRLEEESAGSADQVDSIDLEDVNRLIDIAKQAPIVKFVSQTIQRAVDERATDIHIEPLEDSIRLRFRKDGVLETSDTAPKALAAGIISRVKILSKLNIAERRLPQDGRLRASVRGQDIDFRVSITPSIYGETIVLRILDKSVVRLELPALGYETAAIDAITRITRRPNGIVLLTGPTGSGKTTTLYSILTYLNDAKSKIFTVEDPIEYRLRGITQLQVEQAIGLSFSTALRSILRQDPDIILIGEIRDEETARIAVQAALTGHLVLSTLHTNSAAGAINRLRDMGIENYLLAATLRGVIGQRLVRRSCGSCLGDIGVARCAECGGRRYSGRQAIYEIMEINDELQEAISNGQVEHKLEQCAIASGMRPMSDHAKLLVHQCVVTAEEISRVLDLGQD